MLPTTLVADRKISSSPPCREKSASNFSSRGSGCDASPSGSGRRMRKTILCVCHFIVWSRLLTFLVPQPIFSRPSRSFSPFSYQDACIGSQASAVPFPCVEEEEEPYIIYSSSPNSSLSSLSEEITPVLPLHSGPSPSLSLPVPGVPQPTQRRTPGHHRRASSASLRGHTRKQSLSSICEVPEEDI